MKESHRKDLASHPGPESCVHGGDLGCEALTGVNAGQVLSCAIATFGVPTPLSEAEGNTAWSVLARSIRTLRSRRP